MVQVIKDIFSLTNKELVNLFHITAPDIPVWSLEEIEIKKDNSNGFILMISHQTGYEITLWNNYDIKLHSNLLQVKKFRLMAVLEYLTSIGAVNIEQQQRVATN